MARRALMAHFLGIGLLALVGCAGAGETDVPTSTTAPTAAPVPTSTPVVAASTPSPTVAPTETASSTGIGPEDIIAILPMDAIPAILDPQFLSAASAEDQMESAEQVIGVSINGDNRAYSINMLSSHEIVNDMVGGEAIAVTW